MMHATDPEGNDPLTLAHRYATVGLRVLPIPPGRKHPPMTAWQDAATTDPATLDAWWTGLYAGHGCGLAPDQLPDGRWWFAVDIDQHGIDGAATWQDLCDGHDGAPVTVEATTGGGGTHLLYAAPTEIRNAKLADGIDIRGHGGQIVAEPSTHPSGQPYTWVDGQAPWDHPIADAPGWLLTMLSEPAPVASPTTLDRGPVGDRPGDLWAAATSWADLLAPDGWTLHHTDPTGEQHWTRPGKDTRHGTSATVGHKGSDVLKVFTSSHPHLTAEATYTKLGYLASTRHQGDHAAAARSLAQLGYRSETPTPGAIVLAGPGTKAAPALPWEPPHGLPAPDPPPTFPLASLPTWAQAHVVAVAEQVQVPIDASATLAIGALFAASTGRANVHVSDSWTEPVCAYLVIAMRSGAGKSPAEKYVVRWLRDWQRDRIEAARNAHDDAALGLRHARKKLANLEGGMGEMSDLLAAAAEVRTAEANMPPLPRLLADDATPEAVAGLLAAHEQRLAILSTEADLFDMLLKGKPGQRQNMNVYLKAWGGDSFTRDRKGGNETGPEWSELTNPHMTVSVAVQPTVLARLQADDELVSRGFAARFMFALPADMIGRRDQTKRFGGGKVATEPAYNATATALADRWATWANPADLRFDQRGASLLEAFLVEIEPQLAEGQPLAGLAEWANKLHATIARYAGLLHIAEGRDTTAPIDADTVARAIDLGRYWLGHATAVLGLAVEHTVKQAEIVLEWAASNGARFRLTDCQRAIRRPGEGLDKIADFVAPIELLIDLGWVRPVDNSDWRADVGVKGAKSPDFALWPDAVGKPLSAFVSRAQSFACMGECNSLSSHPLPLPIPNPREALNTRNSEAPLPVDNSTHPVDNSGPADEDGLF